MEDIRLIYGNYLGITFFLKRGTLIPTNKVQLVFNKCVFEFTNEELVICYHTIKNSLKTLSSNSIIAKKNLITVVFPIKKDKEFYFMFQELKALEDLIKGTLFSLNYKTIFNPISNH